MYNKRNGKRRAKPYYTCKQYRNLPTGSVNSTLLFALLVLVLVGYSVLQIKTKRNVLVIIYYNCKAWSLS